DVARFVQQLARDAVPDVEPGERAATKRIDGRTPAPQLYPKLIAAYPDDYVYPYRWGRSLLERGKPAEALPLLEKAADKAYGENRLVVATFRVKALKALHRQQDAEKVVADALEQNGNWFPEDVEKLKSELKS
ncbi:MAG TPA: hypothetical protein VLK83_08460, partial [Rhodanobacteraceae bacterium]|nr:hypothetical protein [Rhodanobacteraceae bacterium]